MKRDLAKSSPQGPNATVRKRFAFEILEDRLTPSTVTQSIVADDIVVTAGDRVTLEPNDVVFEGTVTNQGVIDVGAGQSASFDGLLTGAGNFAGVGDVLLAGDFSPGNSPAIINFEGSLTFAPTATFIAEIGGLTPGAEHDQLIVSENVELNGTLEVQLFGGFIPAPGDRFEIIQFGSQTGNFSNFVGLDLGGGLEFQVEIDADSLDLVTVDTSSTPPKVTDVAVNGATWTIGARSVPSGANQTRSLPWSGANRIIVTFDQDVPNIQSSHLQVFSARTGGTLAISNFAYDSGSFTATWSVATAPTQDKLRLVLDDAVQNGAGQALDGEWIDGVTAYPSGDDVAGGDFKFRLNVMVGAVTNANPVNFFDILVVVSDVANVTNNVQNNLNGAGLVDFFDILLVTSSVANAFQLPVGDPGGALVAPPSSSPATESGTSSPIAIQQTGRRR